MFLEKSLPSRKRGHRKTELILPVGLIQYPYSHVENLQLYAAQNEVLEEMKALKAAGGSTIVENTTTGIKRDLDFLRRVQKEVR